MGVLACTPLCNLELTSAINRSMEGTFMTVDRAVHMNAEVEMKPFIVTIHIHGPPDPARAASAPLGSQGVVWAVPEGGQPAQ